MLSERGLCGVGVVGGTQRASCGGTGAISRYVCRKGGGGGDVAADAPAREQPEQMWYRRGIGVALMDRAAANAGVAVAVATTRASCTARIPHLRNSMACPQNPSVHCCTDPTRSVCRARFMIVCYALVLTLCPCCHVCVCVCVCASKSFVMQHTLRRNTHFNDVRSLEFVLSIWDIGLDRCNMHGACRTSTHTEREKERVAQAAVSPRRESPNMNPLRGRNERSQTHGLEATHAKL